MKPRNSHLRPGSVLALLAACCGVLAVPAPLPAAPPPPLPGAAEIARTLGYGPDGLDRILSGQIVSASLEDSTRKELAMTLSMLIRAPVSRLVELVRNQAVFQAEKIVLSYGTLPEGEVSAAAFADLRLPPAEVQKLARAEPGSEFNLSAGEARSLQDAAPGGPAAVMEAYRALLAQRVDAYRRGGIRAVAPYDRGGGKTSSPAADLRASTEAMAALKAYMPNAYRAFLNYPQDPVSGLESAFYWTVEDIQDRPTAILIHQMLSQTEGLAVMLERQFYVGRSYNCLEFVVGALPVEQGSLVFYVNRTDSDQVAGFGSGAAHKIGKRVMESQIRENFQEVREALEKP